MAVGKLVLLRGDYREVILIIFNENEKENRRKKILELAYTSLTNFENIMILKEALNVFSPNGRVSQNDIRLLV